MQFEELERQWLRLEGKLDQLLALETEIARQTLMRPARRGIHRSAVWPAIDLGFALVILAFVAAFLSGHWRDWRLAAPAIVVAIGAWGLSISSIRQLQLALKLDWCGPVAEIQGSLARLRAAKIQQFKWIILFAPLMGFCGLLVVLERMSELLSSEKINLLGKLDSTWVVANLVFGVLFVPLGYWAANILAMRSPRGSWRQAWLDDISGRSLEAAARDVERWASLQGKPSNGDGGEKE